MFPILKNGQPKLDLKELLHKNDPVYQLQKGVHNLQITTNNLQININNHTSKIATLATQASVTTVTTATNNLQATVNTQQATVNTQSQKILNLEATQNLNGQTINQLQQRLNASEQANLTLSVNLAQEQASSLALKNELKAIKDQLQDLTQFVQNLPQLTQQVNQLQQLTPTVANIQVEQNEQNFHHSQLQKTVLGIDNKLELLSDRAVAVHKEVSTNFRQHKEILGKHDDRLTEQNIVLEKATKDIVQNQSQINVQLNKNTKFEQRFTDLHKLQQENISEFKGKVNKLVERFEELEKK